MNHYSGDLNYFSEKGWHEKQTVLFFPVDALEKRKGVDNDSE